MRIKTRKLQFDPDSYPDNCPPLLARLYASRGIPPDETDIRLRHLPSPFLMRGMRSLCARLLKLAESGGQIMVAADYDADGATACAVAVEGLRRFGAQVDFVVPDRKTMGYGLTPALVDVIAERGWPAAILTVDNGITCHDGVAHAKDLGIPVLITDHHLAGDRLPSAAAIVNPNLPNDPFPGRLAGVGVMFYVLMGMRAYSGRKTIPLEDLLDLVALGTIADMVPMNDRVNRMLASAGLARMRRGYMRPGIQALADVSNVTASRMGSTDIAFGLAPRLNAAGRLDDMTEGIRLLLSTDTATARDKALRLDAINRQRREIEAQIQAEALARLDERLGTLREKVFGITVVDEDWHEGVIGIVASRLRENYNRPVVVFTRADDGHWKGSGRSVPGVHLRDLLARIDATYPGIVLRFGGHAMAAGLTVHKERFDEFTKAFDREVSKILSWETIIGETLETDGRLPDLSLETANWLHQIEPWGQGSPEPMFYDDFRILACRPVGDAAQHLRLYLRHESSGKTVDAISFFEKTPERWNPGSRIRAVCQMQINEYQERQTLQLIVRHLQPAPAPKSRKKETIAPTSDQIRKRVYDELGLTTALK